MLIPARPQESVPANSHVGETLTLGTLHLRNLAPVDVYTTLETFFALGGKYLDVAMLYGGIPLLETIGRYLRSSCAPAKVFVKIGYFENTKKYHDAAFLSSCVGAALDAIGTSAIAILLHEADWRVWWTPDALPSELCTENDAPLITMRMHDLRYALRSWPLPLGIAGNNADALSLVYAHLGSAAPVLVAKQYDLLWRNALPLVQRSHAQGNQLILGAPWHQGWLRDLGRLVEQRPELTEAVARLCSLAAQSGVTVDELALPFIRYSAPTALIAFGARSPLEVLEAFAAAEKEIPTSLFADIESLGMQMPPMGPLISFKTRKS